MKITNRLALPQALVDAVKNDPYDNGGAWRSVTQLIAPPRQIILKKKHDAEIEEDASERLFALYGQIVHGILERANTENLVEERLFMEVHGKKISGAFDTLQLSNGRLSDWKFSTVWKAIGTPDEWVAQMNLLAVLFRANGIEIKEAEIILLMRDHSKTKAKRESTYPQLPIHRMLTPLWPEVIQRGFLNSRVHEHLRAEVELPECTKEDRWQKDAVYAVMKKGRKNALKLYDNVEAAQRHAAFEPDVLSVVNRSGESIRCESYCVAAKFCTQYKAIKEVKDGSPRN